MSTFFNDMNYPTPIPDPITGRLDPNDPAVKAREFLLIPLSFV